MSGLLLGLSPPRRRIEAVGLAFAAARAAQEAAAGAETVQPARVAPAIRAADPITAGMPPMPAAWRARLVPLLRDLDLPWTDLAGPGRTVALALRRQAVMYGLAGIGLSLPQIGRLLNRDHSTVLFGVRAHAARLRPRRPEVRR